MRVRYDPALALATSVVAAGESWGSPRKVEAVGTLVVPAGGFAPCVVEPTRRLVG